SAPARRLPRSPERLMITQFDTVLGGRDFDDLPVSVCVTGYIPASPGRRSKMDGQLEPDFDEEFEFDVYSRDGSAIDVTTDLYVVLAPQCKQALEAHMHPDY